MSDEMRNIKKLHLSSTYGLESGTNIENLPFTVVQHMPVTSSSEVIAKCATRIIAIGIALTLSEENQTIRYTVSGMGLRTTIINGEIK